MGLYAGYAEDGGQTATTGGITSTTKVQRSYPNATVTVYVAGTTTLASITTNGVTTKANPFTVSDNGYWFFYYTPTSVDVHFSGGGITTPYTHRYTTGSGGSGGTPTLEQ